ncbi:hypothetical protein ECDEC6A_0037 [Escherichia coli DEC6A]|nr:hypothetical protein ECDEC6A_0037 [Escherichia coli DEC6A]
MIWQPEFTDKTLSRKPGAVQSTGEEKVQKFAVEQEGNYRMESVATRNN